MNWNMYLKFAFITVGFMMANTTAFTVGIAIFHNQQPLLSVGGIIAVSGIILANCATIQLLLAGKYSLNQLFYLGLVPILGFFISYLMLTKTTQYQLSILLYCISLSVGVLLLYTTMKNMQNKKSLVL